jgi:vacuolar-type H+-ATPase subunit E/Vma4
MNNPIDSLREAVIRDSQALAYAVAQDAMAAGQQVTADMDALIATERANALAKAEQDAERDLQRMLASAEGQIQRERLADREVVLNQVLADVKVALAKRADSAEKGRELLLQLCEEGAVAVTGDRLLLVVKPDHRNWVDGAFLTALRERTGKSAQLADEQLDGLGGAFVVSADGRERFDNTLDNRLARVLDEARAMIWTRMSHAR